MFLTSAAILALMTSDLVEAQMQRAAPEPITAIYDQGQGGLLATFTPGGVYGSVPRGATRIEMAVLNLSASCDADIRIDSVTVRHEGLGDVSDISGVYLADGFRRMSRVVRFDQRSGEANLRVPSLVIQKCGAVRLSILVNVDPNATVASEHAVSLNSPDDIVSTAKSITFSDKEDSARVSASPDSAGAVTLNFLPINGRISYGRIETLARLQFSADANNNYLLKSVVLTNRGTARDMDFIKMRLETRAGEVLTPIAQRMKGKTVTLQFSPTYVLDRSKTVVFLLKGEVRGSQSRKADFGLEEESDLETVIYRPRR